jgi:hypothetical protein
VKRFLAGVSMAALLAAPAAAQVSQTVVVVGSTPVFGTCTSGFNLYNNSGVVGCQANGSGGGGVSSVSFTGGLISVGTPTTTPALTVAGTSGGIPFFDSTSSWASSALLAANAIVVGGGAGVAPSTVTTNATVLTALGATPTGSGGIVLVTSPALVTPALGVATATSLALGGATLGANTFAVTGAVLVTGNVNITTGQLYSINNDTILSRHAAANWQMGAADVAAPVAQTLGVQSVVAGTADTAGANRTEVGSLSTGAGVSGDIIWQTGGTGAASTVQNAKVTALTIKGATQIVNVASVGSAAAPSLSIGNQTTGFYSVSTTGFGIAINGVNKLDYGVTSAGVWTTTANVTMGTLTSTSNALIAGTIAGTTNNSLIQMGAANDVLLTRHAAANWQLGNADAAAPVAQTLGVQSVVAGTSNTAGVNWTLNGSVSTGSGTSGDIIFKTGGTGAAATVQNAEVTALTIKGATQNVVFAAGLVASGTLPTLTTGTCSGSSAAGGSLAGTFVAATCAAGTYILSGLPTAPTGYSCNAEDRTTTADALQQTASSATSATFKATTATSDVIQFNCLAY